MVVCQALVYRLNGRPYPVGILGYPEYFRGALGLLRGLFGLGQNDMSVIDSDRIGRVDRRIRAVWAYVQGDCEIACEVAHWLARPCVGNGNLYSVIGSRVGRLELPTHLNLVGTRQLDFMGFNGQR